MRFEHPGLLWLIPIIIPALGAFFCWAWFKKRRLILQFVHSRLLAQLTVGVSTARQKTRLVLALAATLFLLLSLTRPQWGFDWEEARQQGLDIVVAIDTSRSMLAEDVPPNRLTRAKLAALDLKKLARNDRLGLVAFAGSAFLQCPLSVDDQAFEQSIEALDVSIIPQGGTALSEAIRSATTAFKEGSENHKILVLFTDGEDHDGEALKAAADAAKAGLRIFTIGVGSANGELLRVTDPTGRIDYVKDDKGQVVKSRLNEQLLREIAQAAQGFYMLLSGANTIEVLYERGLAPLPKSEFGTRQLKRHHERFQWFLGFAVVLLFIEMFFPEQKGTVKSGPAAPRPGTSPALPGLLLLLTLTLPAPAVASPGKALKDYKAGKFAAAQLQYERALEENPSDPRLEFNVGAAAFQSKDYNTAHKHLNAALVTDDVHLQQRAYYNLGNTSYRMGEGLEEMTEKQAAWEQAVAHYESALKLNTHDANAEHNLNFVKQRLEELKKQEREQNKDEEKKDEDGEEQEKKDQEKKDGEQQEQEQKEDSEKDQQEQEQQENKSEEEKNKEQEQQQQQEQEQKEQEKKEAEQGKEGEEKDDPSDPQTAPPAQQLIQLTPQQAMQLLDAQRSEERPMIFTPPKPPQQQNRFFKDW